MAHASYQAIDVHDNELSFGGELARHSFPRATLPREFVDWVIQGRRSMYDLLEGKGHARFFDSHLPVVVTQSNDGAFPFNTGNKGVGLLPVADKIGFYCDLYRETFERCRRRPWKESLPMRLDAVRSFIDSGDVCDGALVSLEIFEKTTFANLCAQPLATLHYTGDGPVYRSYQINAVVQILPPENPVYEFAYLSRQLFEYDDFHITQTKFPYAYLFHPVSVLDKTPHARVDDDPPATTCKAWDDMELVWDAAVLAQLAQAPSFVQKFIIKVTEDYASKQGLNRVNQEMLDAIRARYEKRCPHNE